MNWKTKLYDSIRTIAEPFKRDSRVLGVAFGGSIGRGVAWKHSDLELCLLVEEKIEEFEHFNVIEGMGVEIFQFKRSHMERFLANFVEPDESVLDFRIQIYGCRIAYDPSGLLARFKDTFDPSLFHENVTRLKVGEELRRANERLNKAKELVQSGHFRTALAHLRIGLNHLILATYWQHRQLPRSQNRTEYFLRKYIGLFGHDHLYQAFIRTYGLDQPISHMKLLFNEAKRDIHSLADFHWGSNTSQFLQEAVDGNLAWGYEKSILYVNKFCVHVMQCLGPDAEENVYDREANAQRYGRLYRFLNMDQVDQEQVQEMVRLFEKAKEKVV
ncbi:hypothetical protein ASG89_00460 [Paenibacillus sp. Soil766]|uniref:hypothetical protein n=1 Tax=Paenibacillus sp. Soil766 TaxID=1736404 RepID=UPI000708A9C0|nr:hypothetical protein [Paenibacillus sp. Soil766]KRF10056.1 hypothetical protein ASG89_00460 [Paenibacillus sp. Soil766]